MVNLDPNALYANGLSAFDVGNALAATNVVIPSGTAKMGNYEYNVDLNMSVPKVSDFNRLPIKYLNGAPVFLDDVGPVTDTHQPKPTWCASTASMPPTCWSSSTPTLRP